MIVTSLILASLMLPMLLRGLTLPAEPSRQAEEDAARVIGYEAAIREIEHAQHELAERLGNADFYAAAGSRIMDLYRDRIESRSQGARVSAEARLQDRVERDLRLRGLKAERRAILAIARERRIGGATAQKLTRELDLQEVRTRG